MGGFATVWDGIAYRQVSHEEAAKLVAEDKAQNLTNRLHSATDLKFRRQFTGYAVREVVADKPARPAVEVKPTPPEIDVENWAARKKEAAKALGIPFNKITKADVLAYLER